MDAINNFIILLLNQLYGVTNSLGLTIVVFTLLVRGLVLPLSLSSIRAMNKMRELQPELKKLKNKYGKDKEKHQKMQLELYKKYNVNPLAGCLPQIVQIGIFILLYHVFFNYLGEGGGASLFENVTFFGVNLLQKDGTYIMPILAGATQLILSLMIAPGAEIRDIAPNDSKSKKKQQENEKEEGMAEMAASMQKQMMYIFPVMTGFIAIGFPAGLVLYWIVATIFSIVQQWYVSGPGGLVIYSQRLLALLGRESVSKK